jgi:hypothetical protein
MRPDHLEPYPALADNRQRVVTKELRISDAARAEIMDEVRWALYDYGDLKPLAKAIGRSPRCLYALRSGQTRWPRWDTLFALLPHLGLELRVMRITERARYH